MSSSVNMFSAQLQPYYRLMRLPAVFSAISNIVAAHLIVTQGQIEWQLLLPLI
ncbi:MAG: hypothetical protein FD130_2377, partial [Halothiobacillaceae bacterium]